jgi:hypothetical protein
MIAMDKRQNVLMLAVFIVVATVMLSIPMIAPGQTLAPPQGAVVTPATLAKAGSVSLQDRATPARGAGACPSGIGIEGGAGMTTTGVTMTGFCTVRAD